MKKSKEKDSINFTHFRPVTIIKNSENQQSIQTPLEQNNQYLINLVHKPRQPIDNQTIRNTNNPLFYSDLDIPSKCQLEIIQYSINQIRELISTLEIRMDKLQQKLEVFENKVQQFQPISESRRNVRRKAEEINRNFKCPEVSCGKVYGSDISLNLHLRLKHPMKARQNQIQKLKQKQRQKLKKQALFTNNNTSSVEQNKH